jgi:hypothetical protein
MSARQQSRRAKFAAKQRRRRHFFRAWVRAVRTQLELTTAWHQAAAATARVTLSLRGFTASWHNLPREASKVARLRFEYGRYLK